MDCEGPSTPPDIATGARYVLTYRCQMCSGVKLELMAQLEHSHFRRAFIRAVLRSGTFPTTLRCDRGVEFMNAMMAELLARMGTRRIPSMPFGATAQAPVERVHVEEQRALGILPLGVFKGYGGE